MASFGQLRLTKLGAQAQLNAQNGGTPMKFTKIGLGSGVFTGDAADLTALVKEEVLVGISKAYVENGAFMVEGSYANDNQDHSFTWREIGLYFEDENGSNVLYCYSNAGNRYDDIPATADDRYVKNVRIATAFTDADHVTIQVNPGGTYVEVEAFELFKTEVNNHYNNKENPHGVTAAQVGLWNVPNVTTNNQTPTYEEAATLEKLTSGEKLYLAMGKIAKAVSDFISHLANKQNPHGVTADQIGALGKAGGTVTGKFTSSTSQASPIWITRSDKKNADLDWLQDLQFCNADGTRTAVIRAQVTAAGDRAVTVGVSNAANVAPAGIEIIRNEASNYVYMKAPINNYPTVKQIHNTYAGTTALTAGTSALENNCVYQKYE